MISDPSIFKLAQGEYIAPEKIENVYARHDLVAQIFVYGDSLQATLVGIVVPDPETYKKWSVEQGFGELDMESFCKDAAVRKAFLKEIDQFGKSSSELKGFECVKNIHLHPELFTVDNGLLTPTFKLKRHEAKVKNQIYLLF